MLQEQYHSLAAHDEGIAMGYITILAFASVLYGGPRQACLGRVATRLGAADSYDSAKNPWAT